MEPSSIAEALALLRQHLSTHADPVVRRAAGRVFQPFANAGALAWAPGEVARPFGMTNGWLPTTWRELEPLALAAAVVANPRLAAATARANTVVAIHAAEAQTAPLAVVCALRRVGNALCALVHADARHEPLGDADIRWHVVDPDDQPAADWSIVPSLWTYISQLSVTHNHMLPKIALTLPVILFEKALPNEAPGRKSNIFFRALGNEPAHRALIAVLYVHLMGGLPSAAREPYALDVQARIWASFHITRAQWYKTVEADSCAIFVVAAWRSLLVEMLDQMPNARELFDAYYDWAAFAEHTRSDAYDVRTLASEQPIERLVLGAVGLLRSRHGRLNACIRRRSLKVRLASLPSHIGTYVAELTAQHADVVVGAEISPAFACRAAAVAIRHPVGLSVGALCEMGISPRGRSVARALCALWNDGATLKAAHVGSFPPVDRQAAHALFVAIARRDRIHIHPLDRATRDAQLAAVARRLDRGSPVVPIDAATVHICSGTCAAPAFAAPVKQRDCSANGPVNVVIGIDNVAVCGQRHVRQRCGAPLVPVNMLGTAVLINRTIFALCVGCGLLARLQIYDLMPLCPVCAKAAVPPMPAIQPLDAHRPPRRRRLGDA